MVSKPLALITGVSSFTGAHIALALKQAGFQTHATLSSTLDCYEGLKKQRIDYAQATQLHENLSFGSDLFLSLIKELKPSVFINHGAWIENYRSVDFDFIKSLDINTLNVKKVFELLSEAGTQRVIHSGSFFEPGEGNPEQKDSTPAVSIYGVSKKLTWDVLNYWAHFYSVPISKIVIPNPIGPLENSDRLNPIFLKLWKQGKTPELRVCHALRDNLPAAWLADVYVEEAQKQGNENYIRRPSGFVQKQQEFVEDFAQKAGELLKLKTPVNYNEITPDPLSVRVNSEPVKELNSLKTKDKFWRDWLSSLTNTCTN